MEIRVKHLEKSMVAAVADADLTLCGVKNTFPEDAPVSGDFVSPLPWTWNAQMIEEAASRFKSKDGTQKDTRAWAAQVKNATGDWETAGGLLYEIAEESYEILHLSANQDLVGRDGVPSIFDALVAIVTEKAGLSPRRTRVSTHVPDGHWVQLSYWIKKWGQRPKRFTDFFQEANGRTNDSWYFEKEFDKAED